VGNLYGEGLCGPRHIHELAVFELITQMKSRKITVIQNRSSECILPCQISERRFWLVICHQVNTPKEISPPITSA
jgi:hypothetical protein